MSKTKRIVNPETLDERRAFARKLMRAGKSRTQIHDGLISKFGMGLGATWINDEIRRLKTFKKTKAPALANGNGEAINVPLEMEPVGQRYKAYLTKPMISSLILHLIQEGESFSFDGESLNLV